MGDASLHCVLMFSGGRDSTIAALRLSERGQPLTLVTIVSNHLWGIDRVRRRVEEISRFLPSGSNWVVVKQPEDLKTDTSFYEQTCLPCHHAYVVAATIIAAKMNATKLAFGYTRYQNDWPEQTPEAIAVLRLVLSKIGISLELPAHDVVSRQMAIEILDACSVDSNSMEQKCIRQVQNVKLEPERLREQILKWEQAIELSIASMDSIELEIVDGSSFS